MKLHIGGKEVKAGWKILNVQRFAGVDYVGDIGALEQFADASVEQVYASHVLEHVALPRMQQTLSGVYRVIRPGGTFMVSVPDLDVLCRHFISADTDVGVKFHLMRMMFGGQMDADDFHHFGWNFQLLEAFLRTAGFAEVRKVDSFGLFDDTSEYKPYGYPISLNVMATK